MPSDKSGGARAVEKKHAERNAARKRDKGWKERRKALYSLIPKPELGNPERAHTWLGDAMVVAIYDCLTDPGPAPEAQREQLGRLAAQAMKVLDPAKLAAQLEELETALEELRNARNVSTGTDSAASARSTLS